MKMIFETKIISIGSLAIDFITKNNIMVLFGEEVSATLADFCYMIQVKEVMGCIVPGDTLQIDEQLFTITAVGDVVKEHLEKIGHITINFNGATVAELPGTLHVKTQAAPVIKKGATLKIIRP